MAGWLTAIGEPKDFSSRLERFRKVFAVENLPGLKAEVQTPLPGLNVLTWGWRREGFPDIQVCVRDAQSLVLCGVITDIDGLNINPVDQSRVALEVLRLRRETGPGFISRLNGSFSLLFYDRREKEAELWTDRFASRSVWLAGEDRAWVAGNFPSAIAAWKKDAPKLDAAGLWSLVHFGRPVGRHSLFAGVTCLTAGQSVLLAPGRQAEVRNWWRRRYEPLTGLKPQEWGERIASVLRESAGRLKKTCSSPYLFLSGGLDSRIVAAVFGRPLRTITLSTRPNAESRIAGLAARAAGLENRTILRSPAWYLETARASALVTSGLYLNHHTHFFMPVRDICETNPWAEFLLGDLLENFNKHYFSPPPEGSLAFSPERLEGFLKCVPHAVHDESRWGVHLRPEVRSLCRQKFVAALRSYAAELGDVSAEDADRFDTLLRWGNVAHTYTFNMISGFWPLAGERNIAVDNKVDEVSRSIPVWLRGAGVLHRWTLAALDKRLTLLPDANTYLPPVLPRSLAGLAKAARPFFGRWMRRLSGRRKKSPVLKTTGSWLLLHEMYRKDPAYRSSLEQLFRDPEAFPAEIFDRNRIRDTWKAFLAGNIALHFEIEALRSFGSLNKEIPAPALAND